MQAEILTTCTQVDRLAKTHRRTGFPAKIYLQIKNQPMSWVFKKSHVETLLHENLMLFELGIFRFTRASEETFVSRLLSLNFLMKLDIRNEMLLKHLPKITFNSHVSTSLLKLYLKDVFISKAQLRLFAHALEYNDTLESLGFIDVKTSMKTNLVQICRSVQHLQSFWFWQQNLTAEEILSLAKFIREGVHPKEKLGKESRGMFGLFSGYPEETLNVGIRMAPPHNESERQMLRHSCSYFLAIVTKQPGIGRVCCWKAGNLGIQREALQLCQAEFKKYGMKLVY